MIYLASSSSRRIQILKDAGLRFSSLVIPDVEKKLFHLHPYQLITKNVELKIEEGNRLLTQKKILEPSIVCAFDTIVSFDGKIFEKPRSKKEAQWMLTELGGRTHQVLTGYSLFHLSTKKNRQRIVTTHVTMKKISQDEINCYIQTPIPYDKAGGYAAQGFCLSWIQKIKGSYLNILGLPLKTFLSDLKAIDPKKKLLDWFIE